jgi:mRNA interferase MazF
VNKYIPQRGDFAWLDFAPQTGREQAGRRPAIIISDEIYNKTTGLLICCPITSKIKNYPFEVALPLGLKVRGAVLSDHIKNFDWRERNIEFIAKAPALILDEVIEKSLSLIDPESL